MPVRSAAFPVMRYRRVEYGVPRIASRQAVHRYGFAFVVHHLLIASTEFISETRSFFDVLHDVDHEGKKARDRTDLEYHAPDRGEGHLRFPRYGSLLLIQLS